MRLVRFTGNFRTVMLLKDSATGRIIMASHRKWQGKPVYHRVSFRSSKGNTSPPSRESPSGTNGPERNSLKTDG